MSILYQRIIKSNHIPERPTVVWYVKIVWKIQCNSRPVIYGLRQIMAHDVPKFLHVFTVALALENAEKFKGSGSTRWNGRGESGHKARHCYTFDTGIVSMIRICAINLIIFKHIWQTFGWLLWKFPTLPGVVPQWSITKRKNLSQSKPDSKQRPS